MVLALDPDAVVFVVVDAEGDLFLNDVNFFNPVFDMLEEVVC